MRKLCLLVLFVLCIATYSFSTYAADMDLETTAVSEEEKDALVQSMQLQVVLDDSYKMGLQCFDVRQDGSYALAFSNVSDSWVYVYDANGCFMYGYAFQSVGSYGIAFNNDELVIYFSRSQKIAVYNTAGECLEVQKVTDHRQAQDIFYKTYKKLSGREYILERDINIGNSYSRFVTIEENGERTVLFDSSTDHMIRQIVIIVAVVVFFVFVIWGVIKKTEDGYLS